MGVHLETARLRLRHFDEGDADQLVELDADPALMHFITGGEPTCRKEIEQEVLLAFLAYDERWPHLGFWAVEEKASDEFVGWLHLRPGEGHPPEEPELGYRLRRASWVRGMPSRAAVRSSTMPSSVRRIECWPRQWWCTPRRGE